MKKVTSVDSMITISHYKNILISEGIPAFLKNEYLGSIIGEMPFQEVWPELWVENDLDYDRALQLIDASTIESESPLPGSWPHGSNRLGCSPPRRWCSPSAGGRGDIDSRKT